MINLAMGGMRSIRRAVVVCETSGRVREALRRQGVDAVSCDLLPADDGSLNHLIADAVDVVYNGGPWDLVVAHPPCTYLTNSGVWAFHKTPPNPSPGVPYGAERFKALEAGAGFFRKLLEAPAPRVALENPVMHKYAAALVGRRHSQTIQPYQFGDDASKRTCLWLRGLLPLAPLPRSRWVPPRLVCCGLPLVAGQTCEVCDGRRRPLERWRNQTDGGQNKLPPSEDRWKLRSETYPGIADAMAAQWTDPAGWTLF